MTDLNSPGIYIYKVDKKLYIGQAVNILNRLKQHHEIAYILSKNDKKDNTKPLLREGMVWNNSVKIYCWPISNFRNNKKLSSIYKSFSNIWHFDEESKRDELGKELDFWEFMLISYAKFYGEWELTNRDFGSQEEFCYKPNEEQIRKITKKYKWKDKQEQEDFIKLLSDESASAGNFSTRGDMTKVVFPIIRIITKKFAQRLEDDIRSKTVEVLSDYMVDEITNDIVCIITGKKSTTKKTNWKQNLRTELNNIKKQVIRNFAIIEEILEIEDNSEIKNIFVSSVKKQMDYMVNEGMKKIEERLKQAIEKKLQPKDLFKNFQNGTDEVSTKTIFGKENFFVLQMPQIDASKIKISKDHWIYRLNKIDALGLIMKEKYCCNNNDIFIEECKKIIKKSYKNVRNEITPAYNKKEKIETLYGEIKRKYYQVFGGYNTKNSVFLRYLWTFYMEMETLIAKENGFIFEKHNDIIYKKKGEDKRVLILPEHQWKKVESIFQSGKTTIW